MTSDHKATSGLSNTLRSLLTEEVPRGFDRRTILWLSISLLASIAFGTRALQHAFSSTYVLQDDFRQHLFWMSRFVDPELFPHDVVADYFQSVAPVGYALLYRAAAGLGIDPLLFGKLLPMVLGLVTTAFCFGVTTQLLRVPAAGFVASLLLNESLWMRNGLVSATPRAFISPLFLAFLYFFIRRSIPVSLLTIALMGLFFPSIMFIGVGVLLLVLVKWEDGRPVFSRDRRDYLFCAAGLAVAAAVLIPYALRTSGFGPVFTAAEGRAMPEFLPGGRMVVFRQSFWGYWFTGSHTGMFSSAVFSPVTVCLGLLLPILKYLPKRFIRRDVGADPRVRRCADKPPDTDFPLMTRLSRASVLTAIIVASLGMFFAANLLLFKLYLPSRFTVNSFRILLALSAGITVVVLLDGIFRWAATRLSSVGASLSALISAMLLVVMLTAPFVTGTVVDTRYKTGKHPRLYEYLASQPKQAMIASLADEAENLPVFARRPILVGREIALPFHKGYYAEIRRRAVDLINAQYSPDLRELQAFIAEYGVAYLLVDRKAFAADYLSGDKWIMQYQPAANEAIARLKQGVVPALAKLTESCGVLESNNLALIPAECVMNHQPDPRAADRPPALH